MNRPLAPQFLKDYDQKLLLHDPEAYSIRFHWVLYYSMLMYVILGVVLWIIPNNPNLDSPIFSWTLFVVIISIIGLVAWMIYLLRFNVFKRFGHISGWRTWWVFVKLLIASSLIMGIVFVPSIVEKLRADKQYSTQQLANDINTINATICQLEYEGLNKDWHADTIVANKKIVEKDTYTTDSNYVSAEAADAPSVSYGKGFNIVGIKEFKQKIKTADSVKLINDTMAVLYECPNYNFIYSNSRYNKLYNAIKTNKQLYIENVAHYTPINKTKLFNSILPLIERYNYEEDRSSNAYQNPIYKLSDTGFAARTDIKYCVKNIDDNIRNICERKYRFDGDWYIYFRLIYYMALSFTFLLFVFRHTTIKAFFLSLLTGVLLFIFSGIFLAFSSNINFSLNTFSLLSFYTLLLVTIAITVFGTKTQNIVQGIAINISIPLLYYLPLILTSVYISVNKELYYQYYSSAVIQREEFLLPIAEIICPIFFSILLISFIYKVYRKWYALPQQ